MASPTGRGVRAVAGRGVRVAQRRRPAFHRRRDALARVVFVARVRVAAALAGSHVEIDVARDARIAWDVRLEVYGSTTSRLVVGPGARLRRGVFLSLRGGTIDIGARCELRSYVTIDASGLLRIGDDAVLSWGTVVHCAHGVDIGDMTIVGEYSTIADSVHVRTPLGVPTHHQIKTAPVRIGRNVWVAAKATIASGTEIGDLAVIGANSVVTRDVPTAWLAAGVPAVLLREVAVEESLD